MFHKISNGFDSITHTIGDAVSHGYKEVKGIIGGASKTVFGTANNIIDKATSIVNNVVNKGTGVLSSAVSDVKGVINTTVSTASGIIQKTESSITSIVSMPLILLGGGLAYMLATSGGSIANNAINRL